MIKVCTKCIMDNVCDPDIIFDEKGVCNYCYDYEKLIKENEEFKKNSQQELERITHKIKKDKRGKYDSIIGISGGIDSCYTVLKAYELGLNPLIVHYDNGWNSELAISNIEKVLKATNFELYTYINDWSEIRSLQRAFIKSGVVDIELITDQAIVALLFKLAKKFKIKYIITGHNEASEAILPKSWYHWKIDVGNIIGIHKKFGGKRLKSYPIFTFFDFWKMSKINKVETVRLLNYFDYDKEAAKKILIEKYNWFDHGGKHHESVFTRFYQGYILPVKFKIDKRKAHYSTLINSGQLTREKALELMKLPTYDSNRIQEDKIYVMKKLGFEESEFDQIMKEKPVPHLFYHSYYKSYYKWLKWLGKKIV
jgi:N-acetyl sugar amidotransferase